MAAVKGYYDARLKLGRSQKALGDVFASKKSLWPLLEELEARIDKGIMTPALQKEFKSIVYEDYKRKKSIPIDSGALKEAMTGKSPKGLWYVGTSTAGNMLVFATTLPYYKKLNIQRTVKAINRVYHSKLSKMSQEQRNAYYKRRFRSNDLGKLSPKAEKQIGQALLKFIAQGATKRQQKDLSKLYFEDL